MNYDDWLYAGVGGPNDDRDRDQDEDGLPTCVLCGRTLDADERGPCTGCQLETGGSD